MHQHRYEFAHALRGVAALSVVACHFCGVFWKQTDTVTDLLGLTRLSSIPPTGYAVSAFADYGDVAGLFGVGIFFIISGFVITLAITRESREAFLKRRVLRIYPVYIAGFLVMMSALWVAGTLAGTGMKYGPSHIAAHLTIIGRDLLGFSRIDGISWTLEVELYFYLFMAAAGALIIKRGARGVLIAIAVLTVAGTLMITSKRWSFGFQVSSALLLTSGIAYAMFTLKRIDLRALILIQFCASMGLAVALGLAIHKHGGGFLPQYLGGFAIATGVFALCFTFFRDKTFSNPIVNHFADISYPLYAVHGLFGYAIMYGIIVATHSSTAAILGALGATWIAAWMIHRYIEDPAQKFSRRISRVSQPLRSATAYPTRH